MSSKHKIWNTLLQILPCLVCNSAPLSQHFWKMCCNTQTYTYDVFEMSSFSTFWWTSYWVLLCIDIPLQILYFSCLIKFEQSHWAEWCMIAFLSLSRITNFARAFFILVNLKLTLVFFNCHEFLILQNEGPLTLPNYESFK